MSAGNKEFDYQKYLKEIDRTNDNERIRAFAVAKKYFDGLHRISPPTSDILAAYFADLKKKGQDLNTKYDREGKLVEHPSVAQLEEYCRLHDIFFVDYEFPPSEGILWNRADPNKVTPFEKRPKYVWKRAHIFLPNPVLFEGDIEPADIRQGSLGDCWLMCCIAAVAEFPPLVKDIFIGKDDLVSPEGVYQIRLFKEGVEEVMQIDDYFPVNPYTGQSIFAKSNGEGELWTMLIEKAFAKYNGSYGAIATGKPFEGLIDITGCPYYEYRFSHETVQQMIKDGSLHDKLCEFDREGYLMTCKTPGTPKATFAENKPPSGLVPGHAYTIISATRLNNGVRLCQLRNPWGNFEWAGDWGDSSKLWTKALKDEMIGKGYDMTPKNDGMFWMGWDDIRHYFNDISVVLTYDLRKLNPKVWNTGRKTFWFKLGEGNEYGLDSDMYILNVEEAGKFYLSVHQKDKRVLGSLPYYDIGVSILKQNAKKSNEFDYVVSTGCTVERQTQCEKWIEPGEYWIVPISIGTKLNQFKQADEKRGVTPTVRRSGGVAIHSLAKFTVKDMNEDSLPRHLYLGAKECAVEAPCSKDPSGTSDVYGDGSLKILDFRAGYGGHTYAVKNFTEEGKYYRKEFFEVTMDIAHSTNIISSCGGNKSTVVVAPGETEILHHLFPSTDDGTFNIVVESSIRKLKVEEIKEYLSKNPEIKQRLNEKALLL